jgi:hypothetical protein
MNSRQFISALYVIGLAISLFGATSNLGRYLSLQKSIAAHASLVEKSRAFHARTNKEFTEFYRTRPNGHVIIEMWNGSETSARISADSDQQSLKAVQRVAGDAAFLQGMAALIFGLLIVGARKPHAR